MTPLPIDRSLPEIVARLREHRSLVLVAEPGAGKTTRVPPAILRAGLAGAAHPAVVMLQPRRVAARAAAARIAEENGWELGGEVGYHVRFDKRLGPATRLRVVTEGILTRQLVDDPFLPGVGCVILDEFHERSLNTDVTAALLREVRQAVRDDLLLVVMSATLDAGPIAEFLGGAPIVRVEGQAFPVEIRYAGSTDDPLPGRVADAVTGALAAPGGGDVLAFLPGAEEVRRTLRLLEPLARREGIRLFPLHGSLPAEEQMAALRPSAGRKVVVATNIAETSLTIDGVTTVIDGGLARVAGYDPRRGLDRLDLRRISKASAVQRAGRAGRTRPGVCVRLWAEREQRFLDDYDLPEVRRVDLSGTVLALHAWGQPDPRKFGWYEAPPEATLASAERLLAMLGALSGETGGRITPLGRRMLGLPTHPRLARLLIAAADVNAIRAGATIAALLSEKDIARGDRSDSPGPPRATLDGPSDLLIRMQWLDEAERGRFNHGLRDRGIDPVAARQVARTRDDLLRIARRLGPVAAREDPSEGTLLRLPLWAYPDRVCRRRAADPGRAAMVGGGGVRIGAESAVARAEFFVALDARADDRGGKEAWVRLASAIQPEWLDEMYPDAVRRERAVTYDAERGRVVGVSRVSYRDLTIQEEPHAAVDPVAAARVLGEAVRPMAGVLFRADPDAANLLARLALLREAMPEHPWPAFDDARLGDLLAATTHGKRTLDEVRRLPFAQLLVNELAYPLDRLLEQHAPATIAVPTGNRIKVTYAVGAAPVLAVRLQELFGWIDTPRVAGGRVAVLLHLLGPNYRPVQITDDLRSFWGTAYFQVRKDLRTRYPKHSWPEDPLTATPQAKGRSQR